MSATGSAGTIAAGDRLKDDYGARIVAVEALECPTMLANGFGEHNIQGIGDKHIPLIHNVMNTDVVVAVSDRATDQLQVMFASDDGLGYLADRRLVPQRVLATLRHFGLSSICNVLAGDRHGQAARPRSRRRHRHRRHRRGGDVPERAATRSSPATSAAGSPTSTPRRCGASTSPTSPRTNAIECTAAVRNRIFNLGYFTWVEQQGTPIELFEARRDQSFWIGLRRYLGVWDAMIDDFNAAVAAG